jgi:hypothetical protein
MMRQHEGHADGIYSFYVTGDAWHYTRLSLPGRHTALTGKSQRARITASTA